MHHPAAMGTAEWGRALGSPKGEETAFGQGVGRWKSSAEAVAAVSTKPLWTVPGTNICSAHSCTAQGRAGIRPQGELLSPARVRTSRNAFSMLTVPIYGWQMWRHPAWLCRGTGSGVKGPETRDCSLHSEFSKMS